MVNEHYNVEPFYQESQVDTFDLMHCNHDTVGYMMEQRVKQNREDLLNGLRPYINTQIRDTDGHKIIRSSINIGTKKS